MNDAQPPVDLEVPARAEYIRLVRLVVGALAASRRDLDDDRVADLRLAVNEACALAVAAAPEGRLHVMCTEEPEAFVVDVFDAPEDADEQDGVAFALIRALVDDVAVLKEAGATRMRLRMESAPAAGWS